MTLPLPAFTDSIDLRYFLEPLGGPTHPKNLLDRFPDALYNKAPDTHFIRFMYALLGPVGVGWLKQDYLEARLQLEASGLELVDLESFYGDPFSFGRILDETYDDDISALLPVATWEAIKAKDESYRSRAIQFMNATRLGTSPGGMKLAASSGIGQNVEIVENYQYLFDAHSDDPLGLPYFGSSAALGEFIVVPRPIVSRSETQAIMFADTPLPLGTNSFTLAYNGFTTPLLSPTSTPGDVQSALENLVTIGSGSVHVSGGLAPIPFDITFAGKLSNQSVFTLVATMFDTGSGTTIPIPVVVTTGGLDAGDEIVEIGSADRHHMQVALDYLRPVASYPTFNNGRSTVRRQVWANSMATSEYITVNRFVTGSTLISWPPADNIHWIQPTREIEAPRTQQNLQQNYTGFHNIPLVSAYTDSALSDPQYAADSSILPSYNSVHIGPFPEMSAVMPFFQQYDNSFTTLFSADKVLTNYPEPLAVSTQTADGVAFINGIYPADYSNLQGVPDLKYHDDHFWSSLERPSGAEILEIDLGIAQAVNFITFEVTRKPISIEIDYDLLDQSPQRNFEPVTPMVGFPVINNLYFDPNEQNPWEYVEAYFNNSQEMIFTRFIRLVFTRRNDSTLQNRFLFDTVHQVQTPWSIDVRNLRIGRNIPPALP